MSMYIWKRIRFCWGVMLLSKIAAHCVQLRSEILLIFIIYSKSYCNLNPINKYAQLAECQPTGWVKFWECVHRKDLGDCWLVELHFLSLYHSIQKMLSHVFISLPKHTFVFLCFNEKYYDFMCVQLVKMCSWVMRWLEFLDFFKISYNYQYWNIW